MDKPALNPLIIDTPCIGICSTVFGDTYCRGCKRHFKEIIEWNTYTPQQKQEIFSRLSKTQSKIVQEFLVITDAEILLQQLHTHHIRYYATDDPFCWAHHLLRTHADKITHLNDYGIAIKADYHHLSLLELFTLMDEKLYSSS